MKYHGIPVLGREEALRRIIENDGARKVEAVVSLAYYDPDWRWVQSLCIDLINNNDKDLRYAGILCLGHIARVRGVIDLSIVLPVLYSLCDDASSDPFSRDIAIDSLNDIEFCVGFDRKIEDAARGIRTTR